MVGGMAAGAVVSAAWFPASNPGARAILTTTGILVCFCVGAETGCRSAFGGDLEFNGLPSTAALHPP
jgi:hypothetical protein